MSIRIITSTRESYMGIWLGCIHVQLEVEGCEDEAQNVDGALRALRHLSTLEMVDDSELSLVSCFYGLVYERNPELRGSDEILISVSKGNEFSKIRIEQHGSR